jgi:replicative DNA helicase
VNAPVTVPAFNAPPPHSLEAERSVLGAIMLHNDAWTEIRAVVDAEDFYRVAHGIVFRRMEGLAATGRPIDPLTLADVLGRHDELETIGGPAFLMRLTDGVPRSSHAVHYAALVRDYARRRQCIAVAQQLLTEAHTDDDIADVLGRAERALRDVSTGGDSDVETSAAAVAEAFETLEAIDRAEDGITGIRTGLDGLDRMLGGLQRSEVVVLAARPSVGKTALAGQMVAHAAVDDRVPTLFVTLEQPKAQLALRMASNRARVDLVAVREKRVDDVDLERLGDALRAIHDAPITFVDRRDIRLSDIRLIARRLHGQGKCDLLVVDYLTLVQPERSQTKNENRQEQVALQSRLTKTIAKELGIPVVMLAQVSREYEKDGATTTPGGKPKPARRPRLSDLRESGAIEQDADVVLFLHRPYVRPTGIEEQMRECETELIVAKQRNGPIGHVDAYYAKQWLRFNETGRA